MHRLQIGFDGQAETSDGLIETKNPCSNDSRLSRHEAAQPAVSACIQDKLDGFAKEPDVCGFEARRLPDGKELGAALKQGPEGASGAPAGIEPKWF